jgi:hypothetical protein
VAGSSTSSSSSRSSKMSKGGGDAIVVEANRSEANRAERGIGDLAAWGGGGFL